MNNITAIQTNVIRQKNEREMPSPESLSRAAIAHEDAPRNLCASDYGMAINAMRDKGYTWNEVTQWLAEHGAVFSMQAIVAGWRTWKKGVSHDSQSGTEND